MRSLFSSLAAFAAPLALATTYPMTMHTVVDEQGIHGVAFRYLAPKGWKVNAKLGYSGDIMAPTPFFAAAESPDGKFGYIMVPESEHRFFGIARGQYNKGNQSGEVPPNRFSDYLANLAQSMVKGAGNSDFQVVDRKDTPLTREQLGPYRSFGSQSALEFRCTKNGEPETGVLFASMNGQVHGNPNQPSTPYQGDWQVQNLYMVYGPKGEEKKGMRFFSLGVPTYTPTSAFIKARGALILALNQQIQVNIQRTGELSKLTAQLSRQKEDAIMGNYRSQQAAQNKAVSGFCDYIGDIDRYHTADGSEMQLSSGYKDAWTNRAGDVVLSDNIGYDPNQGSGGGWSRLKKG